MCATKMDATHAMVLRWWPADHEHTQQYRWPARWRTSQHYDHTQTDCTVNTRHNAPTTQTKCPPSNQRNSPKATLGPQSNTVFLSSPKVSTSSRTSIRSAVFAELSCVKPNDRQTQRSPSSASDSAQIACTHRLIATYQRWIRQTENKYHDVTSDNRIT